MKKKSWQQKMKERISELEADVHALVNEPMSERAIMVTFRATFNNKMETSIWYGENQKPPHLFRCGILYQIPITEPEIFKGRQP